LTTSIRLENISKRYQIGRVLPSLRSLFSRTRNGQEQRYHWAVKDLNVELQPSDALGIIGPNGAGKTTILKLLSKVTYPTHGSIHMNGRFSALIELGAGFHPDLTGRENIFLNGTILGMKRAEIKARFDKIVDFAGIEKYLDTPVKRYSSGMYARLGFAVAAHVEPDILLVDEVLAVGDMAFQKKCYAHMKELIKNGTTMILVSHNMRAIQEVCNRTLVMYRGHKAYEGSPAEAAAHYSNIIREAALNSSHHDVEHGIAQRVMTHGAVIEEVQMLRANCRPSLTFESKEVVKIILRVRFSENAPSPIFACAIRSPEGQMVYDFTTHWAKLITPDFEKDSIVEVEFQIELNLVGGTYQLGVDIAYQDLSKYYDRIERALDFVVINRHGARGIADLRTQFNVVDVKDAAPTYPMVNGSRP
jgi:lipopolysaccharide transport system ATP-binding protein